MTSFAKPPFFQSDPAASRGLGTEGPPPFPPLVITTMRDIFSAGRWEAAYGWYDFTVPINYVPGSGLTVNIDMEFQPVNPADASTIWAAVCRQLSAVL